MTDIPIDPSSPGATGVQPYGGWYDPALFGPLQRFQAAQATPGSLASVPMPPPRPQGLGQGPVAGRPVPMPPPRPFDLGQSQQPVGSPMQLAGGYRPEGPEATSPSPSQGGPGAGSSNFAAQHPQLPFLQRLMNPQGSSSTQNQQQKQGLIMRMAQALGPQGLFGQGGLGSLFNQS